GDLTQCLQPLTPSFRAPIVHRTCDGSASQFWVQLPGNGAGRYRFLNTSGWCMSVDTLKNAAPVLLDMCRAPGGTTADNAEWKASGALPGVVTLRSRVHFTDNDFCLAVAGAFGDDANVRLFTCNDKSVQRWMAGF